MGETRHFGLPLLAAGQAQKHVTVNTALARLDALVPGVVESATRQAPPDATDGDVHIVPVGAAGAWGLTEGSLAVFLNGGWVAAAPIAGRAVWVRDEGRALRFDGDAWQALDAAAPVADPATAVERIVLDVALDGGPRIETAPVIPGGSVVLGVTARVLVAVAGANGWALGIPDAEKRYGSGHDGALGAVTVALTGAPVAYPAPSPLVVSAEGGSFSGGMVRLCIHCLTLLPPQP